MTRRRVAGPAAARALLAFALSVPSAAFAAERPRKKDRLTEKPEAANFEREASSTEKRAKELAELLRIRGKGEFQEFLGYQAIHEGNQRKARNAFRKMIDADPKSPRGFIRLADTYMIGGDFSGAAILYGEAFARAKTPKEAADCLRWRAEARYSQRDFEGALKDTERSLKLSNGAGRSAKLSHSAGRVHLLRTRALMALKRWDDAAAGYRAFRESRPYWKTSPEDDAICSWLSEHVKPLEVCAKK